MNQRNYIKLGDKVFNLITLNSIETSEEKMTATIEVGLKSHTYKFNDKKEFDRFRQYMKLFTTEFSSVMTDDGDSKESKKEILI